MLLSSAMRNPYPTSPSLLAILLGCIYFCSHVLVVSGSGFCLEDQRSLLLQLKSSFEYERQALDSNKLGSWNQSLACCEWKGVTCDEKGHVIGLDLSEESITGGFDNSSSLFSLQHLRHLNLAYNDFNNSEIPSGFSKLENLTYLNLACAGFSGQVPIEISRLTRLVTLDISSDFIRLHIPNLQELVQNLTNIRHLYLDRVSISAQGQEWNAALLQIPTLQKLRMTLCNLSGPLVSSLSRLENLSVIVLDGNKFSSPVPATFANFKNLTTLSLVGCGLSGMFPHKIFQIKTLSFLDISVNEDLHGFLPEFPLHSSVKTLRVTGTSFSGPLPNSISNLRQLSTLDLSCSQFNGTLPNFLPNLTQLVELDLSSNRFAGPIPFLAMCKELQYVTLSRNYFTGAIPSTHFEGLANLVFINLEYNFITGKIPSSLFMLPSVLRVFLSSNEFDQLDDFTNASSILQTLDLSSNHLEGPIPRSVFQLSGLVDLMVSGNKFNGTIELGMITKLGNLTKLNLSYNNLSIIDATATVSPFASFPTMVDVGLASCKLTKFPQFLKNQSRLDYLDLSNNHIAGKVPHWISSLNHLQYLNLSHNYLTDWEEPFLNNISTFLAILDLHSNYFQGSLPVLPPYLAYLDFSSNNLSSAMIPPNIGTYPFDVRYLSLSSNKFYGNIPVSLCSVSHVEVLDLSNNAFTGTIPKCLIAKETLTILDLGRNKLNGTIDTFPGSCNLRTLQLNGNSLQGNRPESLGNCNMLQVLDLGDNHIRDQFPCWLKNISTLHVLILRSNKFHGSLKCQGTQGAWPHLQIVDLASNNFSGKIPLSFFASWKAMMADEINVSLSTLDHLRFQEEQLPKFLPIFHQGPVYYQDRVTITSKQLAMELENILTIYTHVDLSCNKFEGLLPEGLGQLNALHIVNLSHNAFSGHIPSSFGNMKNLESLDLSNNNLSGLIPTQLASLSFLASLNLSYNHLVGRIPTGTQIQSFDPSSFKGNTGLCGPPLTLNCSGENVPPASNYHTDADTSIDWNLISAEVGFAFGIGIFVLPLVFCKWWRIWYWEGVDNMLYRTFPQLDFVYEGHGGQKYRALRWRTY